MDKESIFTIDFKLLSDRKSNILDELGEQEDFDDVASILQEICRNLKGRAEFVVRAFSVNKWPVDVKTDFSVFLEQLPAILGFLRSNSNYPFSLDFYEQGIERELVFIQSGKTDIIVKCKSRTAWKPIGNQIVISRHDLLTMLCNVVKNFVDCANKICPTLTENILFKAWVESYLNPY